MYRQKFWLTLYIGCGLCPSLPSCCAFGCRVLNLFLTVGNTLHQCHISVTCYELWGLKWTNIRRKDVNWQLRGNSRVLVRKCVETVKAPTIKCRRHWSAVCLFMWPPQSVTTVSLSNYCQMMNGSRTIYVDDCLFTPGCLYIKYTSICKYASWCLWVFIITLSCEILALWMLIHVYNFLELWFT